jgi:hypothetical protein
VKEVYKEVYVECDEGWRGLYEPLLDLCKLYGYDVRQVKEKFGGLRFYYSWSADEPDKIAAIVMAAEAMSYHTCEMCGENGVKGWDDNLERTICWKVSTKGTWVKSLCDPCRAKREEERAARDAAFKARHPSMNFKPSGSEGSEE